MKPSAKLLSLIILLLDLSSGLEEEDIQIHNTLQDQTFRVSYETEAEFSLNLEELFKENITLAYNYGYDSRNCELVQATLEGSIRSAVNLAPEPNQRIHFTDSFLYIISILNEEQLISITILKQKDDNLPPTILDSSIHPIAVHDDHIIRIVTNIDMLVLSTRREILLFDKSDFKRPACTNKLARDQKDIIDFVVVNQTIFVLQEDALQAKSLRYNVSESNEMRIEDLTISRSLHVGNKEKKIKSALQIMNCSDTLYLVYPDSIVILRYDQETASFSVVNEQKFRFVVRQVEISQRAVWILSKTHLIEYLINENSGGHKRK